MDQVLTASLRASVIVPFSSLGSVPFVIFARLLFPPAPAIVVAFFNEPPFTSAPLVSSALLFLMPTGVAPFDLSVVGGVTPT